MWCVYESSIHRNNKGIICLRAFETKTEGDVRDDDVSWVVRGRKVGGGGRALGVAWIPDQSRTLSLTQPKHLET